MGLLPMIRFLYMIWVIPLAWADLLYLNEKVHFLRLFRKQIPDKDIAIQPCGDHLGIILININGGDCGLMQIQTTDKLLIIKIINGDPAIFIPDINSIMRGFDNSDVDVALILIQILKDFTSL